LKDNSPTSYVTVLLIVIRVIVIVVGLVPLGCLYPSFYIIGAEITGKATESVTT
jgi:hypothetical protein